MYNPLVSIVIPVYNGSNFLAEAIDSAIAQTYKNIEILIINDGSTDEGLTEKIALSYGDKIRYFSKENGGVSSALNMGIDNMQGEWFSWLSHDDLYIEDKIQLQIYEINKYINDNKDFLDKKVIILSNSISIDINGKKILRPNRFNSGYYSGNQMFSLTLKRFSLNGCSLLLPKKCFNEVGVFDTSLKYIQDFELWYRLMLKQYYFLCIDHKSVNTRVHSQQVTVKYPELFYTEREKVGINLVDSLLQDFQKNKSILLDYLYFCAKKGNIVVGAYILRKLRDYNVNIINIIIVYKFQYTIFSIMNTCKKAYKYFFNKKYRGDSFGR